MNAPITPAFANVYRSKTNVLKITLPVMNRFITVTVNEILYIQSDVNYCYVYLKDGRKILIAKTLKEYHQQLEGHLFARIHKSYLVNLEAIDYCNFAEYEIQLSNGVCLPIARRKRKLFCQKFNLFHKTQRLAG
ncbi:MAG: LytTR family DNA-binding domain-containing protein [Spirosomataceae bacterium]